MLMFDEAFEAVGGRQAILGSVEVRYDLGMNFEVATFYDIGQLKKTFGSTGSEAFRSSAGLGLRYMTPIGPIGLLYGWKLSPLPGESRGSLHFSMGYTF
jgi:outer membrane protein insertion porin family